MDFREATFQDSAFFSNANFQGEVDFSGASFQGWTFFVRTRFKEDAFFYGTNFVKDVYLLGSSYSRLHVSWPQLKGRLEGPLYNREKPLEKGLLIALKEATEEARKGGKTMLIFLRQKGRINERP